MPYTNQMTEDIFDPFTAYLQKLGLGTKQYMTPAEQYQVGQYDPLSTMYGVQGRMASVYPGQAPGYFSDYASPYAGTQNMYGGAKNLMQQIFGSNPEQRAQMGTIYEPTYAEGARTSSGNIAELQQLLQTALRPTMGRPGAQWLSGNLPAEQQRWVGSQAQGGTGTFLDYLRQKYNLGNFGM